MTFAVLAVVPVLISQNTYEHTVRINSFHFAILLPQNFVFHLPSFQNLSNQPELNPSWTDVALLAFGAMCQQGSSSIPYSLPGRIVTIMMFVGLMFLYTSYSANIVALLQSSSNSIKTLNDLLHSRLSVGVDDTVFNHFYFPVGNSSLEMI